MPKVNTLFSYFNKSPKGEKPKTQEKRASNDATEKTSKNSKHNTTSPKTPKTPKQAPAVKSSPTSKDPTFEVGDLVWAKLEGYPWWPSLICLHPVENIHFKSKPTPQVHVQFFDEPPSRSWIKSKSVKAYKGSASYSTPPKYSGQWKNACKMADKALEVQQKERSSLVVDLLPSDEEDSLNIDSFDNSRNTDSPVLKRHTNGEPSSKRRRIIVESDDSGDDEEFKPDPKADTDDESVSSGVKSEEISEVEDEVIEDSPVKKKRKRNSATSKSTKKKKISTPTPILSKSSSKKLNTSGVDKKTKSKLAAFSADETLNNSTAIDETDDKNWPHLTFDFLKDDKIRDAMRRPKSDLDYDPKTLFVPESFKDTVTPGHKQWWKMKAEHFDTVLFFKVGKFYELYHMDAVTGVTELGLSYMKGNYAHSGFPEIAYGRYADTLVQKGFKVTRIEQTETPQMLEERCKKASKKVDKVVNREICRITSIGTRTCSFIERESLDAHCSYLLALTEQTSNNAAYSSVYGVCFIDTSIGKFYLGQFEDDRHGSRFRSLISHFTPKQIIYEKGKLSSKTQQIISINLSGILKEALSPKHEFWDAEKTLKFLNEGNYFSETEGKRWPDVIESMLDKCDSLGLTVTKEYDLAISALGACTWYLTQCKLEEELLSLKLFEKFEPIHLNSKEKKSAELPNLMVLDGITLNNLDVIQNSVTGSVDGTLLQVLDNCSTAFGKRLLRQWICAPLCNRDAINSRLDAIDDLLNAKGILQEVKEMLGKLPDLERVLSKIHAQGSEAKSESHPDGRAIFFEANVYNKRKIEAFLTALAGFRMVTNIVRLCKKHTEDFKSCLLKQCVSLEENGGQFPQLSDLLEYFDNAFDHKKAKEEGKIIPVEGVDPEYDEAKRQIKDINDDLTDYLETQKKIFGCKVTYFGSGKNRFQLEVPDSATGKATDKHELQSHRKGFKRYWTSEIKNLFLKLTSAEDKRDAALQDIMRRIFAKFDKNYKKWALAVQCLSVLDVLISLAECSRAGSFTRPEIIPSTDDPFIEIRNGYHPCVSKIFTADNFIPNDTLIGLTDVNSGNTNAKIIILSGPNMGGKSTLMRQVGLLVIMAQMGCYVPADKLRLTPVDRIFTRLGASDKIMSGESTFFVELSETASILTHATKNSLVLVDELGRGTATYDGTAIASAVLTELAENIQCRTLFSTHYHSLVEEFSSNPFIKLGHMSCMVENENEDPTEETITFLYKFVSGACPKSYGFNAAKLASIPHEVIKVGYLKAKEFEQNSDCRKTFRTLFGSDVDSNDIIKCVKKLQL